MKFFVVRTVFLLALIFAVDQGLSQDLEKTKKPTGNVSDFAHLLSPQSADNLNQQLELFQKKTGIEIMVVTINSLKGETIVTLTSNLVACWGIGATNENNGVLFLIALKEHQMHIDTSSGKLSVFSERQARKLRDEVILPLLKSGDVALGILKGAEEIMHVLDKPKGTRIRDDTNIVTGQILTSPQSGTKAFLLMAFLALGGTLYSPRVRHL